MQSQRRIALAVLAALGLGATACVDRGDGPQNGQLDPRTLSSHLLAHPPEQLTNKIDADLGGLVHYLGNTSDATTVIPGQQFVIVNYWQVLKAPGPGWRILTRVVGDDGSLDYVVADTTPMRTGYGPASWHVGDIVQDEQTISIPARWTSKTATVWIGLTRDGTHDIGSRAAIVARDGQRARGVVGRITENLIAVSTVTVDLDKAPPPAGIVRIPRATEPIVVDGVASELAWTTAAASLDFVTAEKSPEPNGRATAKLLWDDQYLYAFVTVTDTDVYSQYKTHDDTLWKQDVVEMFIDADSNKRGYIEVQVNPNNATFDKWYQTTRGGAEDLAWTSAMITAVKVRGTPDVQGDVDRGWDAEIAVPWAAVKGKDPAMKFPLPPAGGQKLRMNVVRVDLKSGATTITASSWNQITYADFHALDRMLEVVLVAAEPAPAPAGVILERPAPSPNAGAPAPRVLP